MTSNDSYLFKYSISQIIRLFSFLFSVLRDVLQTHYLSKMFTLDGQNRWSLLLGLRLRWHRPVGGVNNSHQRRPKETVQDGEMARQRML